MIPVGKWTKNKGERLFNVLLVRLAGCHNWNKSQDVSCSSNSGLQDPVNEFRDKFMWLLQGGLDEDAVPGATLYNLEPPLPRYSLLPHLSKFSLLLVKGGVNILLLIVKFLLFTVAF